MFLIDLTNIDSVWLLYIGTKKTNTIDTKLMYFVEKTKIKK